MNEETPAQRNEAKRLEIQLERLKLGYFRAHLLPSITWAVMACVVLFAFRRLVIDGTLFGVSDFPGTFSAADRNFDNGNFEAAEANLARILKATPNHSQSNQLMAQIALAKGNRAAAIEYLRIAAETALNRETILKWIADLEKANTAPANTGK